MSFRKIRSVQVSEAVLNKVCDTLDIFASEDEVKISGWLEVFNNCREQGFVLRVGTTDFDNKNHTQKEFFAWACEARSSDSILVVWSTDRPANNNRFSEEDYEKRSQRFEATQTHEAAQFILKKIKEHFQVEFGGN